MFYGKINKPAELSASPLGGSRDCLSSKGGMITVHSTNRGAFQLRTYMNRYTLKCTHLMIFYSSMQLLLVPAGCCPHLEQSVCLCACVRPATLESTSQMAEDKLTRVNKGEKKEKRFLSSNRMFLSDIMKLCHSWSCLQLSERICVCLLQTSVFVTEHVAVTPPLKNTSHALE